MPRTSYAEVNTYVAKCARGFTSAPISDTDASIFTPIREAIQCIVFPNAFLEDHECDPRQEVTYLKAFIGIKVVLGVVDNALVIGAVDNRLTLQMIVTQAVHHGPAPVACPTASRLHHFNITFVTRTTHECDYLDAVPSQRGPIENHGHAV